ncbi:hypothetical protein [Sphingomonas sp. PAMC 26617]|uniref:hypothetical protein n=1 Tax=Sphingomonas sp. PAMC 26617 TaxID=1112216 RepID=UPI000287AC73|nr:hypothetical protein [Sphingomonas sp. PAMC 26617]
MTMHNLRDRMGRLEVKLMSEPVSARQTQNDAALFCKKLAAIADQMDDKDHGLSFDDRLAMSPATHYAWAMRFAPKEAYVAQIMAAHGRPFEQRA